MFTQHTYCRACGYAFHGAGGNRNPEQRLLPVFDLGVQPLANNFVRDGQERQGYAPLRVDFCPSCTLAQLSVVVNKHVLYRNYVYQTSDSATMKDHFAALVRDLAEERPAGSVVEVGSNNGALLQYLAEAGFNNAVGIEPADNLAAISSKLGFVTINDFLNESSAARAKEACGKVDFVLARHCFCHAHDWREFVAALEILSEKETLLAIEIPYLIDQITNVSFDQVYFEHLSYLSLRAMSALLLPSKLHIHRVIKYPIHGGSILIMLRRNDSGAAPHPSAASYLAQEEITADTWREFAAEAHAQIHKLRLLVRGLRAEGKTVCGYGASAKSTVWLNAAGFTRKDVLFVTDTTPAKQFCMCPGTDIHVTDPGALLRELPDYAIIFAWNYKDEILAKETLYRSKGGRFIVPVPSIKIC